MKLRWAISGESRSKDVNDVKDVISVQRGKLDLPFIQHWTDLHGTRALFERLLAETPEI